MAEKNLLHSFCYRCHHALSFSLFRLSIKTFLSSNVSYVIPFHCQADLIIKKTRSFLLRWFRWLGSFVSPKGISVPFYCFAQQTFPALMVLSAASNAATSPYISLSCPLCWRLAFFYPFANFENEKALAMASTMVDSGNVALIKLTNAV